MTKRTEPTETNPILTCPGADRYQAFRLGSYLIGYGRTEEAAIANLLQKEGKLSRST
jgi:hypothetical protein